MDFLENHIEALIFASPEPIKPQEIRNCLSSLLDAEIPVADVEKALESLLEKYDRTEFAFRIYPVAGGYQFQTKSEYLGIVAILLKQRSKKKLSKSALETLAIIAYRQPISKSEVEKIRGVSSDYAVQKLLEKELIVIRGKADTPGRPLLYGTSERFMEYFGINTLEELPQPKDFAIPDPENPLAGKPDENQGSLFDAPEEEN